MSQIGSALPPPLIAIYLCKEFIRFFFLCLLLFLGLSLLIDFFDRFNTFVKHGAPFSAICRYFLFKLPLFVIQASPAATLAGALLSLGSLSRNRELLALKACGVSALQIATPLLLSACILSIGGWVWNENVVPYAFHKSRYINTVEIKKKEFKGLFHSRGFWYHGAQAFYHIDHFDSRRNILSGLTVYALSDTFQVHSLVKISRASWRDGKWHFEGIQENRVDPATSLLSHPPSLLLKEKPEDFSLVDMKAEELSSRELQAHIGNLQQKGLDTTEYQVDLQLKGALPFAALVMTLLGVALAVPGAQQLSVSAALGSALVVGFGYWVFLALSISLGHSGVLPPILAAWLANATASLVGLYFLLGVD